MLICSIKKSSKEQFHKIFSRKEQFHKIFSWKEQFHKIFSCKEQFQKILYEKEQFHKIFYSKEQFCISLEAKRTVLLNRWKKNSSLPKYSRFWEKRTVPCQNIVILQKQNCSFRPKRTVPPQKKNCSLICCKKKELFQEKKNYSFYIVSFFKKNCSVF